MRRYLVMVAVVAIFGSNVTSVFADKPDTCMVSPTQLNPAIVKGRFGKKRTGGSGNFGSANKKPHMHDGYDLSTAGASQSLFAASDGVITFIGARGTAGNTILIKRNNDDIIGYYHMSGFAAGLKVGSKVKAGQQIGISGNTPSDTMAKHLHFVYGVAQKDEARTKAFMPSALRGAFKPAQLAFVFNTQAGIGWKTDPAPKFCQTFPIQDGHPEDVAILGRDTKEQYAILFGSVPPSGVEPDVKYEQSQVAAANTDAALAAAEGKSLVDWLSDKDGYGSLPTTPIGGYDTMSTSEMMLTEATRRFSDAEWNTNVTRVASRALWIDYLRAVGVSNFLAEAIYRKKERVESLLAIYTSQKLARIRKQTEAARERAQKGSIVQTID